MARRRRVENGLSFFAFQDIITGVSGVMLFILILLVVQLVTQVVRNNEVTESKQTPTVDSSIDQEDVDELTRLLSRKQNVFDSNAKRLELLFELDSSNLSSNIAQQKVQREELQLELASIQERHTSAAALHRESSARNPAQTILEEIDKLNATLRETEEESLEWKDSSRVSYTATVTVPNLYLFDVHQREVRMLQLPITERRHIFRIGQDAKGDSIANSIDREYSEIPREKQDPQKRIVVLIRPSASQFADDLIQHLKILGFEVALELLEAKAELFKTSNTDRKTDRK